MKSLPTMSPVNVSPNMTSFGSGLKLTVAAKATPLPLKNNTAAPSVRNSLAVFVSIPRVMFISYFITQKLVMRYHWIVRRH